MAGWGLRLGRAGGSFLGRHCDGSDRLMRKTERRRIDYWRRGSNGVLWLWWCVDVKAMEGDGGVASYAGGGVKPPFIAGAAVCKSQHSSRRVRALCSHGPWSFPLPFPFPRPFSSVLLLFLPSMLLLQTRWCFCLQVSVVVVRSFLHHALSPKLPSFPVMIVPAASVPHDHLTSWFTTIFAHLRDLPIAHEIMIGPSAISAPSTTRLTTAPKPTPSKRLWSLARGISFGV